MKIARVYEQSGEEKERSHRGRRSRRKGVTFEREIVKLLKIYLSDAWSVKRMFQFRGGKGGLPDVEFANSRANIVFHAECKHGKHPNIRDAMEEAVQNANSLAIPVAITRADRGDIYVTMTLTDMCGILGRLVTP